VSEPTRYDAADLRCKKCQKNVDFFGVLRSHDEGRFVMWDDYASLKAENERLRNLTNEMDNTINISQAACRELKAENERLRKAGDEMDRFIRSAHCTVESKMVIDDWREAKGVQP